MMSREACTDAEMNAALGADVLGIDPAVRLMAAVNAITSRLREERVMILRQCGTTRRRVCCTLWPSLGRQTLHELVSQLHPEGEVALIGLLHLAQSERIENADVDEPPHQERPALATLSAWHVGVVQLIDDIDGAGVMEVVADSLRAAELIDRAIFAPALHGGELVGINVVIQQQDELLVTPGTEGHIASLHLQVGAARDGKELCGRQYSC